MPRHHHRTTFLGRVRNATIDLALRLLFVPLAALCFWAAFKVAGIIT